MRSICNSVRAAAIPFCALVLLLLTGCGGGGSGGGGTQVLYSFGNSSTDAVAPDGELLQASDDNFYGATYNGGVASKGAVFKITPAGAETVLYSFTGGPSDGANPDHVRLIQGSDGNFYSTTTGGGANDKGTVFKLTPEGVVTILHSFTGAPGDGDSPLGGLVQGSDGNFYGTTLNGGANDLGTVFKLTPAGTQTVLYSFGFGEDASHPVAGLIEGSDGNFYGVSNIAGTSNHGTVFKITPGGVETILHSFDGEPGDGGGPYALLQGRDGNFYGVASYGGPDNLGVVFKLTPEGVVTILHSFAGGPGDGFFPLSGLVQGSDGNFYGMTCNGGANKLGIVFKLTPAGVETVLYSFTGSPGDGDAPVGNLVQGSDGSLYGTTYRGGETNQGTFFRTDPN